MAGAPERRAASSLLKNYVPESRRGVKRTARGVGGAAGACGRERTLRPACEAAHS